MKNCICTILVCLSIVNNVASQLLDFFFETPDDHIGNIKFYLFHNPWERNETQEIEFQGKIEELRYHPNSPWKILIPGFTQHLHTNTFPQNVKNAYLKRIRQRNEKWNIIMVDWGKLKFTVPLNPLFREAFYKKAIKNVIPAGRIVGRIIKLLMNKKVVNNLSEIHLVGFSLGAHVAGAASDWLKDEVQGQRVQRITGLDPAGPYFHNNRLSRRLETSDADFVDVYKCNPGGLGIDKRIGIVEFYPNIRDERVKTQPQCSALPSKDNEINICSHLYCSRIYAWALLNEVRAEKCNCRANLNRAQICYKDEITLFGNDVSFNVEGEYFLDFTENLDDPSVFY